MSSMSCIVLTCFAGYSIFHHIKLSRVNNLSTPKWRAHRDGHIICYIRSTGDQKVFDGSDLKDSRRPYNHHHHKIRD